MKKTILLQVAAMLAALTAGAQQVVPNGDFEKWDSLSFVNGVRIYNPEGWISYNDMIVSQGGTMQPVQLTTDAHSGAYAVKIQAKAGSAKGMSGVLVSGDDFDPAKGVRFGITAKVDKVEGYYKYLPDANDSATILVLFYLNGTQIGGATVNLNEVKTTYTRFSLQLNYPPGAPTPDEAKVYILAGAAGNDQSNSVLYLDDLNFIYQGTTGFAEHLSDAKKLSVYPNPAAQRIRIVDASFAKGATYTITDMQGKKQVSNELSGDEIAVDALLQGIYQVMVTAPDGSVYETRFVKQ